jgi:outer membrane lipoprotein-sorting protein
MKNIIARMAESTRNALSSFLGRRAMGTVLSLIVGTVFGVPLAAQNKSSQAVQPPFPDTEVLVASVAEHQKAVEALFNQYTCTYKSTVYTLDKAGSIRSQHTDTYYMTPTPYEVFMLHISRDGKAISQDNLEKQEKEIERKLKNYERKAQKNPDARPKDALLFADIILKSRFTPLRWDTVSGVPTVVYSFEPKARPTWHGTIEDKIAGDLKGTMWVDPEDGEIVRMEFASVSSLSLGVLVNVKGFQGFVEQRKINGEVWLPSRQDFVAQGRELIKGFRIRQVTEFSDYLKASTDVFQQVHSPNAVTGESGKVQQ